MKDYHDLNPLESGINWSALRDILLLTPRHFYHRHLIGNRIDPTKAMTLGRFYHAYLLAPAECRGEFACMPDAPSSYTGARYWSSKEGKEVMEEFKALNAGCEIMQLADYDNAAAMTKALVSKPDSAGWLIHYAGENEKAFQWEVDVPGFKQPVLCRGKLDRLVEHEGKKYVVDYKTCRTTPTRDFFGREVGQRLYHAQLAFYADGVGADGAILVPQETSAPFDSSVYKLSDQVLADGREIYALALTRYAECLMEYVLADPAKASAAWPGLKGTQNLSREDMGGWASRDFS